MIIDRANNSLLDTNNQLVKAFNCPLNKRWSELSTTASEKVRFCGSCQTNVINITTYSEQQIIALFQVNPKACAHINFHAATCDFEFINTQDTSISCYSQNHENATVINTARDIESINRAEEEGYKVVIVPNFLLEAPTTKKGFFVDENLKYVAQGFDYRSEDRSLVTESYHVFGQNFSPYAAYLIPRNFPSNTRIYLPDIIEHLVKVRCTSQNVESRVNSGYGYWDGEKVILDEYKTEEYLG